MGNWRFRFRSMGQFIVTPIDCRVARVMLYASSQTRQRFRLTGQGLKTKVYVTKGFALAGGS